MKKIIFIVIAIILGLSSCHDDDYITGVPTMAKCFPTPLT